MPTNTSSFEWQVKALQKGLEQLKESVQKRIARGALRKAMTVVSKAIRTRIPSPWKDVKKLIGTRMLKRAVGSEIAGKVGVGVGKKSKRAKKKKDRTGRPGVGVGPENVHWFILGTGKRFRGQRKIRNRKTGAVTGVRKTKGPVQYTGIMPSQLPRVVQDGFAASYAPALKKMIEATREGIDKERVKIRAAIKAARQ